MKVMNKSRAVVYVGSKAIKPRMTVELSKDELKMSGVKALIDSGELEIVKESKNKSKDKDKRS